ncbi:MAG: hypothetical protein U0905_10520 [Pirellulales bacterium]
MDLNKGLPCTIDKWDQIPATLKVAMKIKRKSSSCPPIGRPDWLPKPMVENWESQIAAAQQQLAQITPDQAKQIHQSVVGAVGLFVNPQIVQLQNAGSQSEFDGYIDALLEMGKGSLGGGLPTPN